MTDPTTTPTGTSASAEFDRLFGEASDLLARLGHALADGEWPDGLTWEDAGDMARLVGDLQRISGYVFAEGDHAPEKEA
jgi:hypothetical protein